MKKIFCVFLSFIMLFLMSISAFADEKNNEVLKSSVYYSTLALEGEPEYYVVFLDTHYRENAVYTKSYETEMSSTEAGEYNDYYDEKFENADRISTATNRYNCHSYAWHSQDTATNIYWIPDPTAYYTDNTATEVQTPKVGDIICYFDDNGTPNDTSDDDNLHSGIVTDLLGGTSNGLCGTSDLVTVTSKWGAAGLYVHNGYECPYTSYKNFGYADYVKYYRINHTYSCEEYSEAQHLASCTKCDHTEYQAHSKRVQKYNNRQHQFVCECGSATYAVHIWNTDRTRCTLCGFNIEGSLWRLNKKLQDMYTYE